MKKIGCTIWLRPEKKPEYQAAAAAAGLKLSQWLDQAGEEKLRREMKVGKS